MNTIDCVIRNIPNTGANLIRANKITRPGLVTRKRGRGARAHPACGWGGEYQDLPLSKAPRFSYYLQSPSPDRYSVERLYFDYAGHDKVTGKMRVRAGAKTW